MGPYFITMYVYLDDVNENDAPLYVIQELMNKAQPLFLMSLKILKVTRGFILIMMEARKLIGMSC